MLRRISNGFWCLGDIMTLKDKIAVGATALGLIGLVYCGQNLATHDWNEKSENFREMWKIRSELLHEQRNIGDTIYGFEPVDGDYCNRIKEYNQFVKKDEIQSETNIWESEDLSGVGYVLGFFGGGITALISGAYLFNRRKKTNTNLS